MDEPRLDSPHDGRFMCSFCLRSRQVVGRLVAAPNVGICEACAKNAVKLFEGAKGEPISQSTGPWDSFDDEGLVQQLPLIAQARDGVEDHLRRWVGAARERKISWATIGEALGMSRQSAWERFNPYI